MIAFHYNDAMNQAKELRQASEDLYTLLNHVLKGGQSEVACTWKGEGAEIFLGKTEELYKDIEKTAKLLAGVAKHVETSAKLIKEAEDAAKEIVGAVGL